MITDTRKSEYEIQTYSPVRSESEELKRLVEEWVENGGVIKVIPNNVHAQFVSPCFDKSKQELADLARKVKRKVFNAYCQSHGITRHRVTDLECVKCIDKRAKSTKDLVNKYCGVTRG